MAPGRKMCDCIIFRDGPAPRAVLVELERGLVRAGPVAEKFENALEWLSRAGVDLGSDGYRVMLILLHGRHITKSDRSVPRSHMFTLKGRAQQLQVLPCGAQLADLYKRTTLDRTRL